MCVVLIFVCWGIFAIYYTISYNKAIHLMETGYFDDAQAAFEKLGSYKDSEELFSTAEMFNSMTLSLNEDGKSYTLSKIENSDCTSIDIPTMFSGLPVTGIGNSAFSYCYNLTSITFKGTKTQWDAISKGTNWNNYTGSYTIHCTDGDIAKS